MLKLIMDIIMCLLGILVVLPLAFALLEDLMFNGHFLKKLRQRMGITE